MNQDKMTPRTQPAVKQAEYQTDEILSWDGERRVQDPLELVHHFAEEQDSLYTCLDMKERKISRLQRCLAEQSRCLASQENQHKEIMNQLVATRCELAQSQKQIAFLNSNLEDCKERIFAIQPAQGMSDNQLLDLYKPICEGIEEWLHLYCGDIVDTIVFMANAQAQEKSSSWVWLLFCEEELQNTLNHQPIDKAMLASFVFRIMHSQILRKSCPMAGLGVESEKILNTLTRSIAKIQPAKGELPQDSLCQY